jgi:outer membrane protein assembly factor BamB
MRLYTSSNAALWVRRRIAIVIGCAAIVGSVSSVAGSPLASAQERHAPAPSVPAPSVPAPSVPAPSVPALLPPLPVVPAPAPAPVSPVPATGGALPSVTVGPSRPGSAALPWPQPAHDVGRSASVPVPGPDDPSLLGAPWPFRAKSAVVAAPALGRNGLAYVATEAGKLFAVDTMARPVWSWQANGALRHTPALVEMMPLVENVQGPTQVAVGADSGTITVLDANSGKPIWQHTLARGVAGPVVAVPRVGNTVTVFAADNTGAIHRIDETAPGVATPVWASPAGTVSDPAVAVGGTVVYGVRQNKLVCRNASTGAPVGSTTLSVGTKPLLAPTVWGSRVYVVSNTGRLTAVNAACTRVLWSRLAGGRVVASPAASADGVVVHTVASIVAFGHRLGARLWSEALADAPSSRPGVALDAASTAFVPGAGGTVTAYRWDAASTGSHLAWTVRLPRTSTPVAAPSVHGSGRVYVPVDLRVEVIDEDPAFKIAYHAPGAGLDLFTIREVYGTVDPARTIHATNRAGDETEPAYGRDTSILAWDADSVAGVGNGAGRARVAYPFPVSAGEVHTAPAVSAIDDSTGRSLLRDGQTYLAFTKNIPGHSEIRFTTLPLPAGPVPTPGDIDATGFAIRQGLDPAKAATLTGPTLDSVNPTFSPDGRKVAWVECSGTAGSLVLLRLDHTPVDITRSGLPGAEQPGGCSESHPAFSPDSRWVVIESGIGLRGIELDGPGIFTATPTAAGVTYRHPSWSPDGTEIAVTVDDPAGDWIGVLSSKQFNTLSHPLSPRGAQQPSFHLSKLPPPQVRKLGGGPSSTPAAQRPGATIDVYGRGFDLVRPGDNLIYFTDTARGAPHAAPVVGTRIDPASGLGVLTVTVPALAGNGPLTVVTAAGSSSIQFRVLPAPDEMIQRRSVPGARVRVFGQGFDLSPPQSTRVAFPAATGNPVYGTVEDGGVVGNREYLVVTVPDGAADGPVVTESNVAPIVGAGFGCTIQACTFERLHPHVEIRRTGVMAAYDQQVNAGMTVRVDVTDVPADAFFGTGNKFNLTIQPWGQALRFAAGGPLQRTFTLPPTTSDVASGVNIPATFEPRTDPAWDRSGDLDIWLNDAVHPATPGGQLRPLARAPLQTPRLNIPIVFVSGTSGSPLRLNSTPPFQAPYGGETQGFRRVCRFCFLQSLPGTTTANPGASDPQGPRVWLGPEFLNPKPGIDSLLSLCSQARFCPAVWPIIQGALCATISGCPSTLPGIPNPVIGKEVGYPDLLAFNPAGTPINSNIGPAAADPDFRTLTLHPLLAALVGHAVEPVYEDLIAFLTETTAPGTGSTTIPRDSFGRRMLDSRGMPNPRPLNSGPNGVYLFPYDWRASMPTQATALNNFITTSVLARPDVSSVDTDPAQPGIQPIDKVVLITHSLGGPVARLAYLQQPGLIDQVISFGGAFGGVGKTIKILGMGDNWGIGLHGWPFDDLADAGWGITVQPWKVQQLAANWPTAYDQTINSATWFNDHGTVSGGRIVDRTLHQTYSPFGNQSVDNRGKLDTLLDGFNPLLAAAARSIQTGGPALEDFTGGTGNVFHYRIVGQGVPTDVGYHEPWELPMTCSVATPLAACPAELLVPWPAPRAIRADGDDTVPYKSGIGRTNPLDDRVFVMSATASGTIPFIGTLNAGACAQVVRAVTGNSTDACKLTHHHLTNYGISLSLINDILGGRIASQPQATAALLPFGSQTVAENQALSTLSKPAPPPPPAPATGGTDGGPTATPATSESTEPSVGPMELEVRGLVQVRIRDAEGNLVGAPPDGEPGLVAVDIRGAHYRPSTFAGVVGIGDADITLPPTGGFDVELTAVDTTQASVVGRGALAGFSTGRVDLDSGTTMTFHVDPAGDTTPTIRATTATGESRRIAIAALDRFQAADHTPPTSTGRLVDGRLIVESTDDTAGVRDTWVLIDGQRVTRYQGPLPIEPDAGLMIYAVDRADNYEPPHAIDGAPSPREPSAVLALATGDESLDVPIIGDRGRAVTATIDSPDIHAETLRRDDGLHLIVTADARTVGGHTSATVRLRYTDVEAPSSTLIVAIVGTQPPQAAVEAAATTGSDASARRDHRVDHGMRRPAPTGCPITQLAGRTSRETGAREISNAANTAKQPGWDPCDLIDIVPYPTHSTSTT